MQDSQPDDHPSTSEVPSPEARKPKQQRPPTGLGRRASSAAAALFKRSMGRVSASSADAEQSNSMPVANGVGRTELERSRSASQPEAQLPAANEATTADGCAASANGAEAASDAEPTAKRRRFSDEASAGISDGRGQDGARVEAVPRVMSVDRTGSDASGLGGSQERDAAVQTRPLARTGRSLGRRRNGAAGAALKGNAGRRRRSVEGTAAPVTSLIEVSWLLGVCDPRRSDACGPSVRSAPCPVAQPTWVVRYYHSVPVSRSCQVTATCRLISRRLT